MASATVRDTAAAAPVGSHTRAFQSFPGSLAVKIEGKLTE